MRVRMGSLAVCVSALVVPCLVGCQSSVDERTAEASAAFPVADGYFEGADGARLFYRAVGERGDTLVVLHGGPGMDMEYLWPDLMPLSARHTVIHYDQRGSGRSELPSDSTVLTIGYHVRDLENLRIHLGIERLILLAHSYGPALAALYAIGHPDRVERMIFIGPVPPRRGDFFDRYSANLNARLQPDERERLAGLWSAMVSGPDTKKACVEYWSLAMRPRMADPARVSDLKGDPCAASAEALRFGQVMTSPVVWASLGDWDFRSRLGEVVAPVLVIHGEAEPIPMDLVEEWIAALPNASLLRVPGAAHFPYVEQADAVFPAMEIFLAGEWPGGATQDTKASCATAARLIAEFPRVSVTVSEGEVQDYRTGRTGQGCRVEMKGSAEAFRGSGEPDVALREEFARLGWSEDYEYAADGPDGSAFAFRKGPVLCVFRAHWDGGDDSDPTYVPDDRYDIEVDCMRSE